MDPLFPQIPPDLSSLSDSELQDLKGQYQEIAKKIGDDDPELLEGREATSILDEMTSGVEAIERLDEEISAREEAAAEYVKKRDELAVKAGVKTTDSDPGDEAGDEAAVEGDVVAEAEAATAEAAEAVEAEPEPVMASARVVRRPPPRSAMHEPVTGGAEGAQLVASAGIEGVKEGQILDRLSLAEAMIAKRRRITATTPGNSEEVVVASASWSYPEDRQLKFGDHEGNYRKVRAVTAPFAQGVDPYDGTPALLADGGICNPLTPLYDSPVIASQVRPVRDFLPGFNADRGGITFAPPLDLADIDDAIGIITASEDAEGGTFAQKSCQTLQCDAFSEVEIAALFHCVQFGNMGSRAWPERVAQFNEVVMAAWARMAERNLLTLMKTGSTAVTAAAATYGYGVAGNLIAQVLVAAAGYRSRHRMAPNSVLRVVMPDFAKSMLVADLVNSQFNRFDQNLNGVEALFRDNGVLVSWYIDSASGDGQEFSAQAAGALNKFPTTVVWYLYAEGVWLYLDGGTLELGIVRDSTLNANNNYQIFGESFESVAKIGAESLHVTSTVCADGTTAPTNTKITC